MHTSFNIEAPNFQKNAKIRRKKLFEPEMAFGAFNSEFQLLLTGLRS